MGIQYFNRSGYRQLPASISHSIGRPSIMKLLKMDKIKKKSFYIFSKCNVVGLIDATLNTVIGSLPLNSKLIEKW